MKTLPWLTLCMASCFAPMVWAGESGTTLKSTEIMASPFRDAKTIGTLNKGDPVNILKRQGGWYQVTSGKTNGWVRMLNIQRGEARKGSEVTGLAALASGRAGTGKVVATTGVRGLNEEDLKTAQFNEAEINNMEAQTVSKTEARAFAAQAQLKSRRVDYLAKP